MASSSVECGAGVGAGRQTEVRNTDSAETLIDDDVLGFKVAMIDSCCMRGLHAVDDLEEDRLDEVVVAAKRVLPADVTLEVAAGQDVQDDEQKLALPERAVEGDDVRVSGDVAVQPDFVHMTSPVDFVIGDDLEGAEHVAAAFREALPSTVDSAEGAHSEKVEDLVATIVDGLERQVGDVLDDVGHGGEELKSVVLAGRMCERLDEKLSFASGERPPYICTRHASELWT